MWLLGTVSWLTQLALHFRVRPGANNTVERAASDTGQLWPPLAAARARRETPVPWLPVTHTYLSAFRKRIRKSGLKGVQQVKPFYPQKVKCAQAEPWPAPSRQPNTNSVSNSALHTWDGGTMRAGGYGQGPGSLRSLNREDTVPPCPQVKSTRHHPYFPTPCHPLELSMMVGVLSAVHPQGLLSAYRVATVTEELPVSSYFISIQIATSGGIGPHISLRRLDRKTELVKTLCKSL